MKKTTGILASTTVIVIANFIYQYFSQQPDYWLAFDRSFYQVIAIFCLAIGGHFKPQIIIRSRAIRARSK